ncbi:pyruvate formate lyase family protein [Chloroflexota bacterium]
MSERSQRLKTSLQKKSELVLRDLEKSNRGSVLTYHKGVKICLERARLWTESYRESEGEPEVIRRAKALDKVLSNMTIYIQPDELIVGNMASDPTKLPLYPELEWRETDHGLNDGLGHMLDPEERDEWNNNIVTYWRGKSIDERCREYFPEEVMDMVGKWGISEIGWCSGWSMGKGVGVPNYQRVFDIGLTGVIKEIEDRLTQLKAEFQGCCFDDYINQIQNLEAMLISTKAMINFANRYADLARDMAKKEKDSQRKKELEEIADICSWVPANPIRSFRDALQSWYFMHLVTRYIEIHGVGEGSKWDELMYPPYKKDKDAGKITREGAQELLEIMWVKLMEMGEIEVQAIHRGQEAGSLYQTLTIGGVNKWGDDASNEISQIILDASMSIRTVQPSLSLRYHPNIDPALVDKVIDCLRSGIGLPAVYNDTAVIAHIVDHGIPLEDARTWANGGCVGWSIPGKAMITNVGFDGSTNLPKWLELAMNQGVSMLTGQQIGVKTPDPTTFTSVDDILEALKEQVRSITNKWNIIRNVTEVQYQRYMQRPLLSSVTDDCIEMGKDASAQFYCSYPMVTINGLSIVFDELAAINKAVFEDKQFTMAEVMDAWRKDFKDREDIRQALNAAPKFGNDEDYVDLLGRRVYNAIQDAMEEYEDIYGYEWTLEGSTASGYYPWGLYMNASADGRPAHGLYPDGSISPNHGADKKGPTAVIKSVGKIPTRSSFLLNQKFMPSFLEGDNKKLFADYLRTFHDLGCYHVQFNVVDDKTLRDAQAKPESHSDLVVRVAGYSAYFVELGKGVQDDIIARTTQCLGG